MSIYEILPALDLTHWIDLDALNWLPENPVYFYPLLRKQFTSTININDP
jgi:hypothetical protein